MTRHITEIIAENLARLMHEQGFDQVKLAKASGVAQKTISNILNPTQEAARRRRLPDVDADHRATPRKEHMACRVDNLHALAVALGVQPWCLVTEGLIGADGSGWEDARRAAKLVARYISLGRIGRASAELIALGSKAA